VANLHRRLLVSVNETTAKYEYTRVIRTNALLDERKLHLVFDASLWFEAAFALSEVLAGPSWCLRSIYFRTSNLALPSGHRDGALGSTIFR
jgi:hypothetical protein